MLIPSLLFSLGLLQAPASTPPSIPPPLQLEATVDGQPLPLHQFPAGMFGIFEVARPIEVEVRAPFYVRWVDVRPKSAQIAPIIAEDHRSFRFRMKSPVPLTIEFNGEWKQVLHMFANPPEKDPPKESTPGVIYYGPGTHEAGRIELKDGETLYLAPGAWVKGIVSSIGTKNVVIRGRGVLDASDLPRPEPPVASSAVQEGQRSARQRRGRRNMVYLEETEGARVEGITLVNSSSWTVLSRGTRGTHIDGIRILNGAGACSTDGIDLVSSSNALVENVFIRTNDDNIVVKSMDDKHEVHDIHVRRAVLWNEPCGNALEIGFELRAAKIERVRFEDIDIIRVERGSAISIHNGDGATVQDVVFDDIRVEDARHKLIDFAVLFARYGLDRPPTDEEQFRRMDWGGAWDGAQLYRPDEKAEHARYRGHIRKVRVTNLSVVEGSLPFSLISGFDQDHAVEDVLIQGLKYLGQPIRNAAEGKFSIDNARGVEIRAN